MHDIKNKNAKLITFLLSRSKLTTRRPYATRANLRRAMDQFDARQTTMQGDIDTLRTRMDQLLEMLTAQHAREEERPPAAAATTNNAAATVPPVITRNARTLRGVAPFPGVQAHVPPFYGVHTDFFNGMDNQGNVAAAHAATQNMANDEQGREEDEQENLWSTTPQGEEDLQDDYMRQFYQNAPPVGNPTPFQDVAAQRMCKELAEQVRELRGKNVVGLSAADMCLVPDVVIPPKFKVPDFEKYKGVSCPDTHLRMYCRKMAAHVKNSKLMIHCFQDSLSGASLDWYMQLEKSNIRS